ncbi:MAG TPA: serine/threonine-protein kinase [Bryobacteraceae bacterium]|nr:serine/threonine-protein kinase [Bryobacteraceae bacterium]
MDPERWERIEVLYHAALGREPAEREAYLRETCGGDESLRLEVLELIAYKTRAQSFIETPAMDQAARGEAGLPANSRFRLPPGAQLGRFAILKPVGAGGMGEVYCARDTRLNRIVALKTLSAALTDEAGRRRFEREAQVISALTHPNICTLYDIGRDDEIDYLVMEYVEGYSLAAMLRKGPLPLSQVLGIASQVATALDYAHRHGVVHRDLKPGNIMLSERGAKLVDFGIASWRRQAEGAGAAPQLHGDRLTMTGAVVGTPQYMAPEQIRRGVVDARTDVFALGAVIFEMSFGRTAFAGGTIAEITDAILKGDETLSFRMEPKTPQPSILKPPTTLPAPVEGIIRKCLKSDPFERWPSAGDLLKELVLASQGRSTLMRDGSRAELKPPDFQSLPWALGGSGIIGPEELHFLLAVLGGLAALVLPWLLRQLLK